MKAGRTKTLLSFVKRLTRSSSGRTRNFNAYVWRKIMWDDFLYNIVYWCRLIVAIVLVLLLVEVFGGQ